jgi:phospholipase/lecithinase/hemolysin
LVHTYNTSLTLSYNFAYGGATVDASLVAPYESTVKSLIDQTSEFSSNIASKPSSTPWTSANTLFAIWMGVNDIGNSYGGSGESALLTKILNKYFAEAQIMYNAGGRYFAFLTVPPINKTPLMLAESSSAQSEEATVISEFNSQLATAAATFKSQNSGTTVWVIDTQAPFNTALSNPTAYGAASNGATCYNSDGTSCLWWNNYHPGQAIQKLVAQAVANGLKGTFF